MKLDKKQIKEMNQSSQENLTSDQTREIYKGTDRYTTDNDNK
ncbi:hypothetical protein [Sinanaerobacter chloroacetimidivorans]|nr:hypothetical protein [Sinanaerobacter chloroacetimidivorans]